MNFPENLSHWTADAVVECLDRSAYLSREEELELCRKLWDVLDGAQNPTPLGGDGTGGTVEYPEARWGLGNDDKAGHWWHLLSEKEQGAITKALDDRRKEWE